MLDIETAERKDVQTRSGWCLQLKPSAYTRNETVRKLDGWWLGQEDGETHTHTYTHSRRGGEAGVRKTNRESD